MQIDAGGNRKTLCEAVKRNKRASTNGFSGGKKTKIRNTSTIKLEGETFLNSYLLTKQNYRKD